MEFIALCASLACGIEIEDWVAEASRFPPCPTEDSTNCVWRSGVQGDGFGVSFIAYGVEGYTVLRYIPFNGEVAFAIIEE